MSRRDPPPHRPDPTRRRRIEDPDEYQRGRRDGQDDQDPKPADPPPKYADHGESAAETVAWILAAIGILVVLVLLGNWAVNEIRGW